MTVIDNGILHPVTLTKENLLVVWMMKLLWDDNHLGMMRFLWHYNHLINAITLSTCYEWSGTSEYYLCTHPPCIYTNHKLWNHFFNNYINRLIMIKIKYSLQI